MQQIGTYDIVIIYLLNLYEKCLAIFNVGICFLNYLTDHINEIHKVGNENKWNVKKQTINNRFMIKHYMNTNRHKCVFLSSEKMDRKGGLPVLLPTTCVSIVGLLHFSTSSLLNLRWSPWMYAHLTLALKMGITLSCACVCLELLLAALLHWLVRVQLLHALLL